LISHLPSYFLRVDRDIFIDVPKSRYKWTGEMDGLLRHFISQFGKQWSDIASRVPNRAARQIVAHWEKCTNPKLTNASSPKKKSGQHLRSGERTRGRARPKITSALLRRMPKQCPSNAASAGSTASIIRAKAADLRRGRSGFRGKSSAQPEVVRHRTGNR
jgi:hypothetical protein